MLKPSDGMKREDFIKRYRKAGNLNRWLMSIEDFLSESDEDLWNNLFNELLKNYRTIVSGSFAGRSNDRSSEFNPDKEVSDMFLNKVFSKLGDYTKKDRRATGGSVLKRRDMPIEKIIKAYMTYKSTRIVAKKLGLTHPTVSKILKDCGIEVKKPGGEALKGRKREKTLHDGAFAKYIKAHPETVFPRSEDEIAKLIGCKKDMVKKYLYRRKHAMIAKLNKLPDLKKINILLKKHDNEIRTNELVSYEYSVDKFSLLINIHVKTVLNECFVFKNIKYEDLVRFTTQHQGQ